MGTIWKIEAVDTRNPDQTRQAIGAAYSELERIDRLMSEWKPESPISAINAAAGTKPVEVPAELVGLLKQSIAYSQATQGTFDVTWRGMGHLWHFDDSFQPPSPEQVAVARQHIDYRKIAIQGNRVYIPAGMSIGLGGIAKGYAIDRAARVLSDAGLHNTLVDGGGDIVVSGTRAGQPWRLGIQNPRSDHGNLLGVCLVKDRAFVTSGDYERFRIVNGKRYHHIIDPRTGWPASGAASVTILAPTAEQGVVLAKAVFILGAVQGLQLAKDQGVEALLIDTEGRRFATPGFPSVEALQ
jgi:FAD:protein FMN transferase